jgi:hypothetical protein
MQEVLNLDVAAYVFDASSGWLDRHRALTICAAMLAAIGLAWWRRRREAKPAGT